MALIPKEVIRPGECWYIDQDTGQPRKLTVTPDGINYWLEQGKKMLKAGLSIPIPIEHQPDAFPLTQAERAAKNLVNNAGWVADYRIQDGKLFAICDIEDPNLAAKLPKTIKWTSPYFSSFTDGNGTSWDGVISHLALTTRPRIVRQDPFPSIAAALSMVETLPSQNVSRKLIKQSKGITLSRAGLIEPDPASPGHYRPLFPLAFSLYSGAAFADAPPKKKKDDAEAPDEFESDSDGDFDDDDTGGGDDLDIDFEDPLGDGPEGLDVDIGGGDDPGGMDPLGDPLGGGEEDLSGGMGGIDDLAVKFMCGLMDMIGIPIMGPVTKSNFMDKFRESIMAHGKNLIQGQTPEAQMTQQPGMGNKPPPNPNQTPPNPIIQEQPPLYMSLEKINKIADPTVKSIALSLHNEQKKNNALRNSIFTAHLQKRNARIAALNKRLPESGRQKLAAMIPNVKLSLAADGSVVDPLDGVIALMEDSICDVPSILMNGQVATELPHPQEYGGQMSEDRRQVLVKTLDSF